MYTQINLGHHPATPIRRGRANLLRFALALGLILALAPQPAPLQAAPVASIPVEGPAIVADAVSIVVPANLATSALPEEGAAAMAAASIPFDQLGAEAQKQYDGDGLAIVSTAEGVELRSVFQDLTGLVTERGLQLHSVADDAEGLPFAIKATALGRGLAKTTLAAGGSVEASAELVRYVRDGMIEEISTSTDGIRQDFVLLERPAGQGELWLELAVSGAAASMAEQGIRLQLDDRGRELVYSRLHVSDATGRQLAARFEALSPTRLAVKVDDSAAVWPLRIDPLFSDADWVSMGGFPGTSGSVETLATNGVDLFVGGHFAAAGNVVANHIAKWDGSTWSALGTGMDDGVLALAVNGGDLYAGGMFTTAGGVTANGIAKWDGSTWSALGSGMDRWVKALAVSGGGLYAGGFFTTAGGVTANHIAKWDGSAWSALSSGMDDDCRSLGGERRQPLCRGSLHTPPAGSPPAASPSGTAAPGPPWVRGWMTVSWPWR